MYAKRDPWDGHEGPRPRLVIGPGVVALETVDMARRERTYERQLLRRQHLVQMWAAYALAHDGERFPDPVPFREVKGWSAKSRARMVRRLAELDYTPLTAAGRLPAMVTLTYPGDWEIVAPSGRDVKRHFKVFRKRYKRAWGEPLVGVWKLEFQRRGAAHLHIYMTPPLASERYPAGFKPWLSATWADVVAHPDPEQRRRHQLAGTGVDYAEGMRSADPRRLAVYFSKHGTFRAKEYQHEVPGLWQRPGKGPGRFWGYLGLKRAVAAVEVTPGQWSVLARTLRRYSRSQGVTRLVTEGRKRPVRRRVVRFRRGRGFLCLNDGPSLAAVLSRVVPP